VIQNKRVTRQIK